MNKILLIIGIFALLINIFIPICNSIEGSPKIINLTNISQTDNYLNIANEQISNWPIKLGTGYLSFSSPVYGDIDGDGDLEAISPVISSPFNSEWSWAEGIYAFHHDGNNIDFDGDFDKISPLIHLTFSPAHRCQPVTLANLDEDPSLEIIYKGIDDSGLAGVHAFNGDGSKVLGWPYIRQNSDFIMYNYASTVAADLNNDGNFEIIFSDRYSSSDESTNLYVVDSNGNDLQGWPISLYKNDFGIAVSQIAVADLNGDGNLEIIVSSSPNAAQAPNTLFAFDIEGNVLWSHNFRTLDFIACDLDTDEKSEVIAIDLPTIEMISGSDYLVSHLTAWNFDGNIKYNKDIIFGEHISYSYFNETLQEQILVTSNAYFSSNLYSTDILIPGDLNLDGYLEIVISTRYFVIERSISSPSYLNVVEDIGKIQAITLADETQLLNFPIDFDYSSASSQLTPVIVAERLTDVNGDGEVDIIATQKIDNHEKNLFIWSSKGQLISSSTFFSTTICSFYRETVHMTVTIGDLNQNGIFDLCIPLLGSELHLYEIEGSNSDSLSTWPVYRGNIQQTGSIISDTNVNNPPYIDSISGIEYGKVGLNYGYNFTIIDPEGDSAYLLIDWGDGNIEGWLGPYNSGETVSADHIFYEEGLFYITAKAKDINDATGVWSEPFEVNISEENLPPYPPDIDGPTIGNENELYNFTFYTTDPEGDDLFYYINWGDENIDNWIGPYKSGNEITLSHNWSKKGTFTIRAKAKDTNNNEGDFAEDFYIEIIEYNENKSEIEVSIKKGLNLGKISSTVQNIGNETSNELNFTISAEYGFFNKNTKNNSCDIESLAPNESLDIEIKDLHGFGFIDIKAIVSTNSGEKFITEEMGFIIFKFIYIF